MQQSGIINSQPKVPDLSLGMVLAFNSYWFYIHVMFIERQHHGQQYVTLLRNLQGPSIMNKAPNMRLLLHNNVQSSWLAQRVISVSLLSNKLDSSDAGDRQTDLKILYIPTTYADNLCRFHYLNAKPDILFVNDH